MDNIEARAYTTKRYKELTKELPNLDAQYKVNLIIKELRVKHKYATLAFSTQHSGYVRVKSVELPCEANGNLMNYNLY